MMMNYEQSTVRARDPLAIDPVDNGARINLEVLAAEERLGITRALLPIATLAALAVVAGGGSAPSESIAAELTLPSATAGFPKCDFASGGFVQTDQNGIMYQCLDNQWTRVRPDEQPRKQFSYLNVDRSYGVALGGLRLGVHVRFERFVSGDYEGAVVLGLNQASIGQRVGWSEARGHLGSRGTYIRDFSGETWWDSTDGQ